MRALELERAPQLELYGAEALLATTEEACKRWGANTECSVCALGVGLRLSRKIAKWIQIAIARDLQRLSERGFVLDQLSIARQSHW